jgi:hypothetical protein
MRILLGVLIFLGAAAAADTFLSDGRYTRTILGYFNISWVSAIGISPPKPDLSRFWKIP